MAVLEMPEPKDPNTTAKQLDILSD